MPQSGGSFLMSLTAAIRSGSGGPPVLGRFSLEQQIYKRLGQTWDQFKQRPYQEVQDYLLIIQLICREEEAQNRRRSRGR